MLALRTGFTLLFLLVFSACAQDSKLMETLEATAAQRLESALDQALQDDEKDGRERAGEPEAAPPPAHEQPTYAQPAPAAPPTYGQPPTSAPPAYDQPPAYGQPPTSAPPAYDQPPAYGQPPTTVPPAYDQPPSYARPAPEPTYDDPNAAAPGSVPLPPQGPTTSLWAGAGPPYTSGVGAAVGLGNGAVWMFNHDDWLMYAPGSGMAMEAGKWDVPVDATAYWDAGQVLVFSGAGFVLFDAAAGTTTDPAPVGSFLPVDAQGYALPWPNVDAAIRVSETNLLLFRDAEYVSYDMTTRVAQGPAPLSSWAGWPARWADGIDAGFAGEDGFLHLFRGNEYVAFDLGSYAFASAPQAIDPTLVAAGDAPQPPPQTWQPAPDQIAPGTQPGATPGVAGRGTGGAGLPNVGAPPPGAGLPSPDAPPSGAGLPSPDAPPSGAWRTSIATPEGLTLESFDPSSGGVISNPDERLTLSRGGTIEFWVVPEWPEESQNLAPVRHGSPWMPLVRHGSASQEFWAVLAAPGKDAIAFDNGYALEWVPADFGGGGPHHVAVVVQDGQTSFYLDGKQLGPRRAIGFGPHPGRALPLAIGEPPFEGKIGRLRVYGQALGAEAVQAAKRRQDDDHPAILAALTGRSIRINDPAITPEGVWHAENEALAIPVDSQKSPFFYRPIPLLTVSFARPGSPLAAKAGVRGADDDSVLLVMQDGMRTKVSPPGQFRVEALQRSGRNEFAGNGKKLQLERRARSDGSFEDFMTWGNKRYKRATRNVLREGTYLSFLEEGGKLVAIRSSEVSYSPTALDPWDFRSMGVGQKIFANERNETRDFDTVDVYNVPRGFRLIPLQTAKGAEQCDSVDTTNAYHESLRVNVGVGGGYVDPMNEATFKANAEFRNQLDEMTNQKRMHCIAAARCHLYLVQLDRANTTVTGTFADAVERLKNTRDYAGFVRSYGTHYPNAVMYGARAVKDSTYSEDTYALAESLGVSIEAAISGKVSGVQGQASGGAAVDTRERFEEALKKEAKEWKTIGGTAGFSAENFSCPSRETVVAVGLDLRPLDELLSPPLFTDPDITTRVRSELRAEIERELNAAKLQVAQQMTNFPLFDKEAVARARKAEEKRQADAKKAPGLPLRTLYATTCEDRNKSFSGYDGWKGKDLNGGCYACPTGFQRNGLAGITTNKGCQSGDVFSGFQHKKALHLGPAQGCAAGDLDDDGTCKTCSPDSPDGRRYGQYANHGLDANIKRCTTAAFASKPLERPPPVSAPAQGRASNEPPPPRTIAPVTRYSATCEQRPKSPWLGWKGKDLNGGCYACPTGFRRNNLASIKTKQGCEKGDIFSGFQHKNANYYGPAEGCPGGTFERNKFCLECTQGTWDEGLKACRLD